MNFDEFADVFEEIKNARPFYDSFGSILTPYSYETFIML